VPSKKRRKSTVLEKSAVYRVVSGLAPVPTSKVKLNPAVILVVSEEVNSTVPKKIQVVKLAPHPPAVYPLQLQKDH
jgi:hypothetical protein